MGGGEARAPKRARGALGPHEITSVRVGNGANCSSVGSVVDTLFVSAAVGGAIFAAICAALREEPVRVVGEAREERRDAEEEREP